MLNLEDKITDMASYTVIACRYGATEHRHTAVELAAHELIQRLDRVAGIG